MKYGENMNKKEQDILQTILKLYCDLYPSREIFNKNYFKFTPEELENVIKNLHEEQKPNLQKNQNGISESILSIKTVGEVKSFYLENLRYDRSDSKSKEECLKNITGEELKYLYSILYSSPIRTKIRKVELLDLIEKYFDSIDRAFSMKP